MSLVVYSIESSGKHPEAPMRLLRTACVVTATVVCPALAAGQQRPTTTIVVNETGSVFAIRDTTAMAAALLTQSAATDISMRPSVNTSDLGRATSEQNLVYICNNSAGQAVDCQISINHQAVPLSGGHDHHDSNRPRGTLSATSGHTGLSGFATLYTAPEVCGVVSLGVSLVFPPVPPATVGQTVAFTQTIGIEIPDLLPLPAGSYTRGAAPGTHGDYLYGTSATNAAIIELTDAYAAAFPGSQLALNDMSLVAGGLFDYQTPWSPPHVSHRFGNDVDVNNPGAERRRRLIDLAEGLNFFRVPEGTIHFRLR